MKRIAILGSTGSIGANTLDVVRHFPGRFEVAGLAAGRNTRVLLEQARELRPRIISAATAEQAAQLRTELAGEPIEVLSGQEGQIAVAADSGADLVVSAMVGALGFVPTLRAISKGKDIALANKETLVVAGPIIAREAAAHKVRLLPVDSEHSAIWQSLAGQKKEWVRRLILTASGGPFLNRDPATFDAITVSEALEHPKWRMGRKITIDSATLMNKGLEMIEAHFLFDEPADKLEVVVHPQSVIHSMVELHDGSIIAQLGTADMRIPIQLALTYPERWENRYPKIDFTQLRLLEFCRPDVERFPCLALARSALATGGTMTAVLSAANEVAVESFLEGKIRFTDIPRVVDDTMQRHNVRQDPGLEDVLESDRWARTTASFLVAKVVGKP
jgi:1-deoxy-D-xylulose-5-phosphate reductoisomerase